MLIKSGSFKDEALDPRVERTGTTLNEAPIAQTLVGGYDDFVSKLKAGQVMAKLDNDKWAPYVTPDNGLTVADNGVLSDQQTVDDNAGVNGTNMIGYLSALADDGLTGTIIVSGLVHSSMMVGYDAACKTKYTNLLFV